MFRVVGSVKPPGYLPPCFYRFDGLHGTPHSIDFLQRYNIYERWMKEPHIFYLVAGNFEVAYETATERECS